MLGAVSIAWSCIVAVEVLPLLVKLVVLAPLEPGRCELLYKQLDLTKLTYRAECGRVPCRNTL